MTQLHRPATAEKPPALGSPMPEQDNNWFSEGNLSSIAEFLSLCPDRETLGILRSIYPSDVLRSASRRLNPETFARIKRWTIELNLSSS